MWLDVAVQGPEGVLEFLEHLRLERVKRTHISVTVRESDSIEVARRVSERFPVDRLSVSMSAKAFADAPIESSRVAFRKRFEEAKKIGIKKFVFVSGYLRSTFDSLEILRAVDASGVCSDCEIMCAYNPYFDPGRLREEQDRLRTKLGFSFVKGVVLQIGMDVMKLRKGVEFVRTLSPNICLIGRIPVPTESMLERLRAEAPHGVFLPNSYLLSTETAIEMTRAVISEFKEMGIEPMLFTTDSDDVGEALKLF